MYQRGRASFTKRNKIYISFKYIYLSGPTNVCLKIVAPNRYSAAPRISSIYILGFWVQYSLSAPRPSNIELTNKPLWNQLPQSESQFKIRVSLFTIFAIESVLSVSNPCTIKTIKRPCSTAKPRIILGANKTQRKRLSEQFSIFARSKLCLRLCLCVWINNASSDAHCNLLAGRGEYLAKEPPH